ncbi:hypothetical protein FRC06_002621, partial [Ceratobasidium sp. 370]
KAVEKTPNLPAPASFDLPTSATDTPSSVLADATSSAPEVPAPPPAVAPTGLHSRGSYSAVPNTAKLRARAPKATCEAFLNLMVLTERQSQEAKEVVLAHMERQAKSTSEPAPKSPLGPVLEPQLEATSEPTSRPVPTLEETEEAQCRCIAGACMLASIDSSVTTLASLVAQVELAIWFLQVSAKRQAELTVNDAYKLLGKTDIRPDQFKHWRKNGHMLLRLIYATSVHILPAIAVSSVRTATSRLQPGDLFELENAMWDFSQCEDISEFVTNLVRDQILPFHQDMAQRFPNGIQLAGQVFGVSLKDDDLFLQNLFRHGAKPHEVDVLPRCTAWTSADLHSPLPVSTPDSMCRIDTNFQPSLSSNATLPVELQDSRNTVAIHNWTVKERNLVLEASYPETLEKVSLALRKQLSTGAKIPGSYVRLSAKLTQETDVLVYGAGGTEDDLIFIALSGNTASSSAVEKLANLVQHAIAFDGQDIDSAAQGLAYDYKANHLAAWNRWASAGQNVPQGIHPRLVMASSPQTLPHLDRAVRGLADHFDPNYFGLCPFDQLDQAFSELLQPAVTKLYKYIPGLMKQHEDLSNSLGPCPGGIGTWQI